MRFPVKQFLQFIRRLVRSVVAEGCRGAYYWKLYKERTPIYYGMTHEKSKIRMMER